MHNIAVSILQIIARIYVRPSIVATRFVAVGFMTDQCRFQHDISVQYLLQTEQDEEILREQRHGNIVIILIIQQKYRGILKSMLL